MATLLGGMAHMHSLLSCGPASLVLCCTAATCCSCELTFALADLVLRMRGTVLCWLTMTSGCMPTGEEVVTLAVADVRLKQL